MQTKENLELIVEDLFKQLKNDNVIYAEIRFAPLLHCDKNLTESEVVKIVSDSSLLCSKKYEIFQKQICQKTTRVYFTKSDPWSPNAAPERRCSLSFRRQLAQRAF